MTDTVPAAATALPVSRSIIETQIAWLIELLDLLDPDPDLEPWLAGSQGACSLDAEGDDVDSEPSLGAPETVSADSRRIGSQVDWAKADRCDCEEVSEDEGAQCDDEGHDGDEDDDPSDREPSLGSFDRMVDQRRSYQTAGWHGGSDCEVDRSDFEPSLGSVTGGLGNQEHWAQGKDAEANGDELDENGDERDDDNDSGCADPDGMEEQTGLPHAGRGILMLEEDVEAARETTRRLGAILARISSANASAVRS